MADFVHLHMHSEYSISDGLLTMKSISELSRQRELAALALTDKSNLFAFVKFHEMSINAGVKPIAGIELSVESSIGGVKSEGRIVLLAMNNLGYSRLIELASGAYTNSSRRGVVLEDTVLSECNDLIVLSGGIKGHIWDVLQRNDLKTATIILRKWKEKLGDRYFLELTRTGRLQEENHVQELLKISLKEDISACSD